VSGGTGPPARTMTDGVLASFEPIYANMGLLGWSAPDVDAMEVWQVARFLGDDDFDPVPRGTRDGLRISSDHTDSPGKGRKAKGQYGRFDPRRLIPRASDPGKVLTGDDAR
jgi:hypothetical protein